MIESYYNFADGGSGKDKIYFNAERVFDDCSYKKKEPSLRNPFQIDRDRIIHSSSFRRLRNKTQVFGVFTLDYYRTRLTHSLEVSQIARAIAANINNKHGLNISLDLIEAIALAHDIGHPPFGHLGEEIINSKLSELTEGRCGFEANGQNIRILNFLEKKLYDNGNDGKIRLCGLNPCLKTIDGILKYKLPFKFSDKKKHFIYDSDEFILRRLHGDEFIYFIKNNYNLLNANSSVKEYFFELTRSLECQILNAADDIAYATHDLEDGVESKLVDINGYNKIKFDANEKNKKSIDVFFSNLGNIFKINTTKMPQLEIKMKLKEFFSNYISKFIVNIDITERKGIFKSANFLSNNNIFLKSADNNSELFNFFNLIEDGIPGLDTANDYSYKYSVVGKNNINEEIQALKTISYKLIMENRNILFNRNKAKHILIKLFDKFSSRGNYEGEEDETLKLYPDDFQELYNNGFYDEYNEDKLYKICADYISGMTDLYAMKLYSSLFETANISDLSPF
ncbi:MAG: dNTP triphosphohydrolase [Candidatus Acididesulfobacter guangdongensis]|uniref:DNTP triphosphohydrolase n=1 Tax=Acididesulfobacter guangdongensis TaxID=2597225 RepID=A0A519BHN3_ACIG2|nr:MAG: dNTP triphosphohydrolase [Candidatus Acididesulfobacter guangdongensis]